MVSFKKKRAMWCDVVWCSADSRFIFTVLSQVRNCWVNQALEKPATTNVSAANRKQELMCSSNSLTGGGFTSPWWLLLPVYLKSECVRGVACGSGGPYETWGPAAQSDTHLRPFWVFTQSRLRAAQHGGVVGETVSTGSRERLHHVWSNKWNHLFSQWCDCLTTKVSCVRTGNWWQVQSLLHTHTHTKRGCLFAAETVVNHHLWLLTQCVLGALLGD